jgi:hypothetical protein
MAVLAPGKPVVEPTACVTNVSSPTAVVSYEPSQP